MLDEYLPATVAPPLTELSAAAPPDDGMAVNEASPWVRDKLRIMTKSDPAFCRWGDIFYVDAFAGSGVNVIPKTPSDYHVTGWLHRGAPCR